MIQDPAAKGEYRSNYTKNVGGKIVIKPEHEWVISKVEPIVGADLWDRCNAILDARKTEGVRPGPRPVHTFTGLVLCHCGKKMHVPSNSPKYICKACKNKIPVVDLENVFRDELKDYLVNPENVAAYVRGANRATSDRTDLLSALHGEQKRVREEIESTFSLYHSGGLSVDQFKARFQPLDARAKEIEVEIPRLQGEIDCLKVNGLSAEKIIEEGQEFYAKWPKMTQGEKRSCVESLVKSIVIGKDEVTINACYVPSLENMTESVRSGWASFTFCHLRIQRPKPPHPAYPRVVRGIGGLLRRRRLDLGLTQAQAGAFFGVHEVCVRRWEQRGGVNMPAKRFLSAIHAFLNSGIPGG